MKLLLAAGLNSVLFSPFDIWYRGVGAGLVLDLLLENCTPPVDLAFLVLSQTRYSSVNLSGDKMLHMYTHLNLTALVPHNLGLTPNNAAFMSFKNKSRWILLS